MKVPLVIGILLVACAQCFPTPSHVIKRAIPNDKIQEVENALNQMRKALAQQYQIANMQEMKWDSALENMAAKTCTDSPGPNYVVFSVVTEATESAMKDALGRLSQMTEEQLMKAIEPSLMGLVGIVTPTQNKIGIAQADCGEHKQIVFLTGPKSSIGEADFTTKGEPGSKCDNGKASSGLCSPASVVSASKSVSDNQNVDSQKVDSQKVELSETDQKPHNIGGHASLESLFSFFIVLQLLVLIF